MVIEKNQDEVMVGLEEVEKVRVKGPELRVEEPETGGTTETELGDKEDKGTGVDG